MGGSKRNGSRKNGVGQQQSSIKYTDDRLTVSNRKNTGTNPRPAKNNSGSKRKRPEDTPPRIESGMNGTVYGKPPYKYICQVGQGTYGVVYKAQNTETKSFFAMKRLRIDNETEGFPLTAAREVTLLHKLKHRNIVRLNEMVVSKNEIYMALDYVEHDLAGLLLNKNLLIEPCHAKSLIKQTLSALSFLHGRCVLHRDIKGSNILVTSKGVVKLADFGLARQLKSFSSPIRMTNRVITTWYRSPELLLGTEYYGPEVDMWSAGCILVEIFSRQPLFCGKDEVSQLQAVFSVMGLPTEQSWPGYQDLPWYGYIKALDTSGIEAAPANRFKTIFSHRGVTEKCFDLATKLLQMNPKTRISASDALEHSYFQEEPREIQLDLQMESDWHDWEAKRRKKSSTTGVADK